MDDSIKHNLSELEKLYVIMNDHFFYGDLPNVIITMNPSKSAARKTSAIYGWCTTKKIWSNLQSNQSFYEISISPEFIDRSILDIASTLLHEMTHLYNIINDIKDCSRNGTYHNKKFKATALDHGLSVRHSQRYGWNETDLKADSSIFISSLSVQLLPLVRKVVMDEDIDEEDKNDKPKKKKKNGIYYYCERCNLIVATKKKANLICGDCNLPLKEYDIE